MRWWSCWNMGNSHAPLHVDPTSNNNQGSSRSIRIRNLPSILDFNYYLYLIQLMTRLIVMHHACVSYFPGCGEFESWVSWTNHSVCGHPFEDLITSRLITQQWHDATANIDTEAPSLARVNNDVMPWLTSSWRQHRQQDSTMTSCHSQHRLGNTIASKTWRRHHATTNTISAVT
jgi:hypothetical protein